MKPLLRSDLPRARPGQAIGLLGGSFDPAHGGHLHVSRIAIQRLGLDRVWWLVSPGNPLKTRQPADMGARMARAREEARDPRIEVTDIEARLGTRFTADTLRALLPLYPGVPFVWLMGEDNLAGFHNWQDWQEIARRLPICVVARPGYGASTLSAPMARRFRGHRLFGSDCRDLAWREPPAWCLLTAPERPDSSSLLRARGAWPSR